MPKVYFLCFSWLLLVTLSARAQSPADPNLAKLIPPSPQAASLGIYGDIPVSKYTGVPNVEVPIYTLQVGSLSLPVNLSYHASGIKVAQEASWVGLGWSLNAGGAITRTVVGVDDFDPNKVGYSTNSPYPPCENGQCDLAISSLLGDWTEIQQGRKDAGPDQFYYNVGGYAGKMVYVPSKKSFVSLKADNIKIVTGSSGWVFTLPNGTRYVFGTAEQTFNYQRNEQAPLANAEDITNTPGSGLITSWQLDSIVAPTKEYIYFKYNATPSASASMVYQSQSYRWMYQFFVEDCSQSGGEISTKYHNLQQGSFAYSQSVVKDRYLEQIQGSNGITISFTTTARQDIKAYSGGLPQKLSKITIRSSSSEQVLEHSLEYSYFPSLVHEPAQDYKYLRLRLDAITASGINPGNVALSKPPHRFTYNNGILPAKNSFNMDHWGYYNGANNDNCSSGWSTTTGAGGTLIPTYTLMVGPNTQPTTISGADRAPNPATVQNGMLTGITYPTGGSDSFTYEINGFGGGWQNIINTKTYAQLSGSTPLGSSQANQFKATCIIPTGERIILSANTYPIPGGAPGSSPFTTYCENGIKKYQGGNMSSNPPLCFLYPYADAKGYGFLQYNAWTLDCGADNTTLLTKDIGLSASNTPNASNTSNTYTLSLEPAPGFIAGATVKTEQIVGRRYVEIPAGGVRIQQVVANSGQQQITKRYSYLQPNGNDLTSSGLLLAPVAYTYTATPSSGSTYLSFIVNRGALNTNEMLLAQSASCLPMSASAGGSSVGYGQVTETTLNEQGQPVGQVVETFQNAAEQASYPGAGYASYNPFLFPGLPVQPKNDNGLSLGSQVYAADGKLVKATAATYELNADATSTARQYITYGQLPFSGCANPLFVKYFDYTTEWWRKVVETTTDYATDHAVGQGSQTVTTYHYDDTNKLVNEQSSTTSTGDVVIKKTYFAHNSPTETQTSTATLATMAARYMIGIPLKQETFRGSQRVQASVTNYSSQLLPVSQQLLEGDKLPLRLVYDSYDAQGNLQQYHAVAGQPTALLWGYQHTTPVLAAHNASYTALSTAVSQALNNLGFSGLNDLDRFLGSLGNLTTSTQQQQLRTFTQLVQQHSALRNALVTVYTHHPLFGKLSETDPSGRTTFYEYDGLGRLIRTRDEKGRILSQQDYHYGL